MLHQPGVRPNFLHRQWIQDGDDRTLEWRPIGYEPTSSQGTLLNRNVPPPPAQ